MSCAYESDSPESTFAIGMALGKELHAGDTVLLTGDLGAGKTQFAKGVLSGLGSTQEAVSPTFNIILEYDDGRIPLVHMDLYRLKDASELEDIDFYALTDERASHACLIEWADLFPDEMPDDCLQVSISRHPDAGMRTIDAEPGGPKSSELLVHWLGVIG